MLHFAAKLFISFVVSSWIYSEITLLCPPIDQFAKEVFAVLRIPTHDEWPAIAYSPTASALDQQLEGYINSSTKLAAGFANLFQEDVKTLWQNGNTSSIVSHVNGHELSIPDHPPFLSGEEIFVKRSVRRA